MNNTRCLLSAAYQLNRYIVWDPEMLDVSSIDKAREARKVLSGLWGAWWGALYTERELWGEDITDLVIILQHLIHLCHQKLFFQYSHGYLVDYTLKGNNRNILKPKLDAQVVRATDPDVSIYLPPYPENDPIGFLVAIPQLSAAPIENALHHVVGSSEDQSILRARQVLSGIKCSGLFVSTTDGSNTAPAA
jgi:hypothetical protein